MIVTRGLGRPARGVLVAAGLAFAVAAPPALDIDRGHIFATVEASAYNVPYAVFEAPHQAQVDALPLVSEVSDTRVLAEVSYTLPFSAEVHGGLSVELDAGQIFPLGPSPLQMAIELVFNYSPEARMGEAATATETLIQAIHGVMEESVVADDQWSVELSTALSEAVTASEAFQVLLARLVPLSDSVATTEAIYFILESVLAESATVQESLGLSVTRPLGEVVTATEFIDILLSQALTDTANAGEARRLAVAKKFKESVGSNEVFRITLERTLTDAVTVSEQRYLQMSPGLRETTTANVALSVAGTTVLADSITGSEAGTMVFQDYADPSYFAESYVSTTRGF